MRYLRSNTGYLLFPIAGVLASLLIPADRLALRILVGAVVAGLGVIAADAGYQIRDLRGLPGRLATLLRTRPGADLAPLAVAIAFVLLGIAAVDFSPMFRVDEIYLNAVVLTLGGAVALWFALRSAPPPIQVAQTTDQPLQPGRSNPIMAGAGILLLLLAGELAGRAFLSETLRGVNLRGQALIFYGGIALVVMGLAGVPRLRLPRLDGLLHPKRSWLRSEVTLVLLIFLTALLVRAWNLESGLRVSVDEALAIDGTVHYYGGAIGLVGRPSEYITTLLMPQWQGELINLMGRSVTSLRMVSAIIGALTVVVTYFLARDLFKDRLTGLIAALVLMTFPPHVHFSRISLIHIADPLFGALGVWFLIRGLRFNRRLDWALAGASLALTQYFFEAGRLFYIPLVVVWLIGAVGLKIISGRQRGQRILIPGRGIFITLLTLILVATPVYYAIFSQSGDANPRLTTSGGLDIILEPFQDDDGLTGEEASELARRLLFPFTVYVSRPELAVFYGGRQPLLLLYVVPFFLAGAATLIWRWRSAASILVLWLLLIALTNALLRDSAVYARWHVVFPAVAVATAVALRYLVPMLFLHTDTPESAKPEAAENAEAEASAPAAEAPSRAVTDRRVAFAVVAVLTAALVVGQGHYYYAYHVPDFERQAREDKPYPDGYDAGIRAAALPDFTDIYLIADPIPDINVPRNWIIFLSKADVATLDYFPLAAEDFTEAFVTALPPDRNLGLFIDTRATDAILLAVDTFGCRIENSPYTIDPPSKEYVLCFVDRALSDAVG